MEPTVSSSGEMAATSSAQSTPTTRRGVLYVCIAVMFFSTGSVLVLWSQPFTPIEIAFWRLAIATVLVAIMGMLTHQSLRIAVNQLPRFLFYGLVTAMHFLFYIASLSFTTIAHSLAIVYTSPIFVTLFSVFVLHESLPTRKYVSTGIAILGIAILAGFEPHYTACSLQGTGHCMVLGDGMALLSAICFALYSIAGRGERERHPLFRYTTNVYGLAALWLLPAALFFAFRHAYPLTAISAVAALGVFPLGLGHTLYNASVRHVHASYTNLIATQEVTLGVLLGIIFFHQIPSITAYIGGIIALIGIIGVLI
jgi:drug/metabolite transporter (DMT)-like permease